VKGSPSKILPSVLKADGLPGTAWEADLQAPIGDGTNVSIPPMFGGLGPVHEITGVNTPKLGQGTANPTFHGGG
jgi:hypothetical protein